jgi:hypothetical protein
VLPWEQRSESEGYEARDALIRMGEMLRKVGEASGLTQQSQSELFDPTPLQIYGLREAM